MSAQTVSPESHSPHAKQLAQVMLATLLVAGTPVAAVWWLRESGAVDSTGITLAIGMALSLSLSWAGRVVWERRQRSEDLLFSELMVWGYLHRWNTQRRLGNAAEMAAPLSALAHAGERVDPAAVRAQTRLLERLVAGMETRDPYLHGHSRRVARHAWMIARHMRLGADEVARVRTAAALHDVGKTKTPKTILHKAGPLTDEEYRIIKLHPGEGADMAAVLGDPVLTDMIRYHHERLDGSGYPDGLRGDRIPLGARIIAVADTFDAITSARPYRAASPHRKAIDILGAEAGSKLDPDVVRAFRAHYAGRGPLALWSFLGNLPERLLSWITAGAASVASAAKVVAVAALVGGVAATGSTLGLTGPADGKSHHLTRVSARTTSAAAAVHAGGTARGTVRLGGGQPGQAGQGAHGGRHGSAPATAGGTGDAEVPSSGSGTYVPAADHTGAAAERGGSAESSGGGQEGSTTGGHEETPGKPVSETPAPKATHEEPAVKAKGGETTSKGKAEELPPSGKPEETVSKGKAEEPPSGGKPEEPASKGGSGKGSGKPEAEAGGGHSGEPH